MRVSLIIPTYNRAELVQQAVESVLAQTRRPDEIIVVDDGSTDETPEVLATYGGAVSVLRQSNGGVSSARNAGFEHASGDLIAFLDSDDVLEPTSIEKRAALLESQPEVGGVYTDVLLVEAGRGVLGRLSERRADSRPQGMIFAQQCRYNVFQISAAMFRRECAAGMPLFDADYEPTEDYEFWLRLAARCAWAYIDEPLTRYRVHDEMVTRTDSTNMLRQVIRVREKGMAMPEFAVLSAGEQARIYAGHAFDQARLGDVAAARRWLLRAIGRDPAYLKGYGLAALSLLGRGPLLRVTERVQRLRGDKKYAL